MKNIFFAFGIVLCFVFQGFSAEEWGRTGHRVTGEIAQQHLNRKAKKAIAKLLNHESLAFVSTYGDEIRSDDLYREYGSWHYVNIPFDKTYDTHPKSERGDIIVGINKCISVLKDANESKEQKAFHLRMLVHFIGDLHQPLHTGLAEDRGGNTFQVQWFDEGTNLHTVWDTKMIEEYNMSYSELAVNQKNLSKEQIEYIQSGGVLDWLEESRTLCKKVYRTTKVGEKLSYRYMYDFMPIVHSQLQKGGIRLASILNEIFG